MKTLLISLIVLLSSSVFAGNLDIVNYALNSDQVKAEIGSFTVRDISIRERSYGLNWTDYTLKISTRDGGAPCNTTVVVSRVVDNTTTTLSVPSVETVCAENY